MRAKLKAIKVELRKSMHDPITITGAWVKQMLQGHLNYYAVSAITRACGGSATR
jgi:RNA-directed DNA polymerase